MTAHTWDVVGTRSQTIELHGFSGVDGGPEQLRFTADSSPHRSKSHTAQGGSFQTAELRCMDLGELLELVLWQDDDSVPSAWKPTYLAVQHSASGQVRATLAVLSPSTIGGHAACITQHDVSKREFMLVVPVTDKKPDVTVLLVNLPT